LIVPYSNFVIVAVNDKNNAKKGRDTSQRKWVFDENKLNRLYQLFNLSLELKVTDQAHQAVQADCGMAKYMDESEGHEENDNKSIENIQNTIDIGDTNTP
jgi:hypothetical protein